MAKKYYGKEMKGNYAGYNNRREMEYNDSMMLMSDKSAIANMPQQVIYKNWPMEPYYNNPGLNDTIRGIDSQMHKDMSSKDMKKKQYPEKY